MTSTHQLHLLFYDSTVSTAVFQDDVGADVSLVADAARQMLKTLSFRLEEVKSLQKSARLNKRQVGR